MSEWKSTFHRRINELYERAKRNDYKITQEGFAKKLGTSRSGLRGWLSGAGQPDADALANIAKVENVSLYWLIDDTTLNKGLLGDMNDGSAMAKYMQENEKRSISKNSPSQYQQFVNAVSQGNDMIKNYLDDIFTDDGKLDSSKMSEKTKDFIYKALLMAAMEKQMSLDLQMPTDDSEDIEKLNPEITKRIAKITGVE